MSDELTMEQKLELVRIATMKGLGVGKLGSPAVGQQTLPDMPRFAPATMVTEIIQHPQMLDEPFDNPVSVGSSTSSKRPLDASYNSEANTMSVRGAYWRNGSLGDWVVLLDVVDQVGTQVYLVIEQDSAQNATIVAIQVRSDSPDPRLELDASPPYRVTKAHVLIAEVVDGAVRQYETGNMTLGLHQLDGSVTRWPEFLGGSPPPITTP